MKLVFVLLFIIFGLIVCLYRAYHALPLIELKRRARTGTRPDKDIYKVAAHERGIDTLLLILGLAGGAYVLVASARYSWWAALLFLAFLTWATIIAAPPKPGGWLWRGAGALSPAVFKILEIFRPLLDPLASLLPDRARHFHSGLYEKEDLIRLLNIQNRQVDNRVDEGDLKMALGALTFGDKRVADVMRPRRDIHFVLADDLVGPVTIDELHKTGQSRFPVVKEIRKNIEPEVVGTLLLSDIVGLDKDGPVSGVMHKGAHFINETSDLHACLDAFVKTRAHLLVVVNNFEEVSGAVSLDDVLAQILGKPLNLDFSDYHDKKAVAGLHTKD